MIIYYRPFIALANSDAKSLTDESNIMKGKKTQSSTINNVSSI